MNDENETWSNAEFGGAELGDKRRTERLVRIAARAAESPAGRITQVFEEEAEREGAFRFVQNSRVEAAGAAAAAHRACAERAKEFPYVFVPTDQTSLNLADWKRSKGLGVVGSRLIGAQGLEVMSAIAVAPDGVPLGMCGQEYWARRKAVRQHRSNRQDRRSIAKKETHHWLAVMGQVREAFASVAPQTRPWFQLDRGGDAWPVILEGLEPEVLFTVRAAQDRCLWPTDQDPPRALWGEVESSAVLGHYDIEVPAAPGRAERTARMEVRATELVLRLRDRTAGVDKPATLFAVMARETSRRKDAVEWLLLTSFEVHNFADATTVISGYAQRWRIEQFHRLWKSGHCNVEDTLLGARDHIERWAIVLASVAMRLLRLTYLARRHAERLATVEFARNEIDAVILLHRPEGIRRGHTPNIGTITTWIAKLGGYTGTYSGGPPGALVIGRGLDRIQPVVEVLRSGAEM